LEQLEIVERYLDRMRRIYAGDNFLKWEDRHFNKDDVQSFFVHCNHLRDWILKLNKIGITKADINEFIKNNMPLQICADLANSSKHCRLERKTWSGREPRLAGATHQSSKFDTDLGVKSEFQIWIDRELFDALEIAEQCWTLWGEFIERYKENRI
jgi:hypothetical protein